MKKIIYIILIIIGIGIICYPTVSESYYDYKRKEIMKDLEVNNQESKDIKTEESKNIEKDSRDISDNEKKKIQGYTIKIEKINLYQPILEGATEENLKISIASVNKEVQPGQNGNYALAGHRSHTYGRNFNRLDEVKIGDKIEINDGKSKYIYIIDEKYQVKPEEVWVLDNKNYREITLITCDPMINPTHRLIIKGKIDEKK